MRHLFRFPGHVKDAVREHVRRAIEHVDPMHFRQEPAYVAALAARLIGVAYDGADGKVVFTSTIVSDRGRESAESFYGADLAITADVSNKRLAVRKAILVQAKIGAVSDMHARDLEILREQIEKMRRVTRSPKVMEILEHGNVRMPRMVSGSRVLRGERYRAYELPRYFVARVLSTRDGDTRGTFVDAVQDSKLTRLHVLAELDVAD